MNEHITNKLAGLEGKSLYFRMLLLEENEPEMFKDLAYRFKKALSPDIKPTTISTLTWLANPIFLELFLRLLIEKKLIAPISLKKFQRHFITGFSIKEKIIWLADENKLVYLIEELRKLGILAKSRCKHKQVAEHFKKESGEFDPSIMKVSLKNCVTASEEWDIISSVIEAVSQAARN